MHGARRLAVCVVVAMLVGSLNGQVSNPLSLASLQPTLRELISGLADARPFAPRLAALPNWSSCEPLRTPPTGAGWKPNAPMASLRPGRSGGSDTGSKTKPAKDLPVRRCMPWGFRASSALRASWRRIWRCPVCARRPPHPPASGEVWDYFGGTAYYVRGDRRGNPEDFVRSLAACDRSLQANPGLRAALFNRALALAALYVRGESARAWQRFLLTGDSPEWKREARAKA